MTKFLIAMAGVIVSSIIIFSGLLLYKKFFLKSPEFFENEEKIKTFHTPKNMKEAVNSFLENTKGL